ncbi:MAG: hypothetical protein J5I64_06560 [Saprospiraceae bacterium]|nr:hypothetical protein [Saprospiraceae bacterium]
MSQLKQILTSKISVNQPNPRHLRAINLNVLMSQLKQILTSKISVNQPNPRHLRAIKIKSHG